MTELSRRRIVVRSWRITDAEPSGCHMWFDPYREIPMIGCIPPPSSEDSEPYREGRWEGGTLDGGGVVPREGGDTNKSDSGDPELPF